MTTQQTKPSPQLESVEQVSDGWLKKYILHFRLPDGRPHTYEGVSRKSKDAYLATLHSLANDSAQQHASDAVCIVACTRDGRLVAIREFRYPLNSWCIQFPAGIIDPGEDIEHTVERELMEETGYPLARDEQGHTNVHPLAQPGISSAGMSEESVRIVFAEVENEPRLGQHTESTEYIEVFTVPIDAIGDFLKENTLPMGTRSQLVFEGLAFCNAHGGKL